MQGEADQRNNRAEVANFSEIFINDLGPKVDITFEILKIER